MAAILNKMLLGVGYDSNLEELEGTEARRFSINFLEFELDHNVLQWTRVSHKQSLSVTKTRGYLHISPVTITCAKTQL